jgi:5-methylcytosine-specific restriction protein A
MTQGLPDWTRDELILAVDLYLRHGEQVPPKGHRDIVELSKLLRSLPIHDPMPSDPRFRGPGSVYRKLNNIHTSSPDYPGARTKGNRLDGKVLAEFKADPERFRRIAQAIHATARTGPVRVPDVDETEGEQDPPEGRQVLVQHYRRERNPAKVKAKKEKVLAEIGRLECEVCGFDFATVYGERGEGFIECHHRIPLSESGVRHTRLKDLALVCSNCHRMIHRGSDRLTVEELRDLIRR